MRRTIEGGKRIHAGTVLTVWDALRGTAVRSSAAADVAFGLPGDRPPKYPQGWARQLVEPFASLAARLAARQAPVDVA